MSRTSRSAATASISGWIGRVPSRSIRSVSMNDANRSPIFCASAFSSVPSSLSVAILARSSMIAWTCSSATSASCTNGPQLDRSAGMSASASQRPLTWPNRSSCGRTSGSMPSRASSRMLTRTRLVGRPTSAPSRAIPVHLTDANRASRAVGTEHERSGPAPAFEQRCDLRDGLAAAVEHLAVGQPNRGRVVIDQSVEVALGVPVPGSCVVVEGPPVELDLDTEVGVGRIAIDGAPCELIRSLTAGLRQSV